MGSPDRATMALKTELMLKPQKAGQDLHHETKWVDCLPKKDQSVNALPRMLTGPECHNITLKMSMIQSKITQYTEDQENPNNFQDKRQQA